MTGYKTEYLFEVLFVRGGELESAYFEYKETAEQFAEIVNGVSFTDSLRAEIEDIFY